MNNPLRNKWRAGNGRDSALKCFQRCAKEYFLISLFFLTWLVTNNSFLMAAENNTRFVIEPDSQFEFADSYFQKGRYLEAVTEFERFIHFFPEKPGVPEARYRIGLAFFNIGRYKEAIESFSTVIERHYPSELAMKSYFRMSESFIKLDDPGSAIRLLRHLSETAPSELIRDEAFYRIGWINLELGNFSQARDSFAKISRENRERFRLRELTSVLSKDKLFLQKDPFLAGAFSIIPGAGFLYTERYQDALTAFLLNSAFIWAAYESFESGNEALGGIVTFVGSGFYLGNIYGAVSGAHKYNRRSKRKFLEDLHLRTGVTLSDADDMGGLFLGVSFRF